MNRSMRKIQQLGVLTVFSTVVFLGASCGGNGGSGISSADLGTIVQTGVLLGSGDEEKAKQYGNVAGSVSSLASDVSPEMEYTLGEGLALRSYATIGPRLQDETVQRYVNLVARSVVLQSSRPDLQFSVAVLDSETINAFAAPGGFLFITTGALKRISNEAELAAVLGHEVAHVTERHMIQTYKRARLFEAANQTLEALSAEEYSQDVDFGSDVLFNKGLDQKFEYEADSVGVQLAALTGYDPAEYLRFLNTLASLPNQQGGLLSTHPSASSRIRNLQPLYATDLKDFVGVGVQQQARYQANVLNRLSP